MKKNYLYNLSFSVTNILFPVLSFPYASRILGPQGIGKVQIASSFAQYFALFAALGIPIYGVQEVAKIRHNKNKLDAIFSELLTIYFATSIIVTAVYGIVILSFPYFAPNIQLYCYAGLIILLGFSSIDWLYSGLEDFKSLAVRTIVVKLAALAFLYLFVRNADDYLEYLFVTIFALIGNNVINFLMIRKKAALVLPTKEIFRHLKPLFFIFSTTIAASMYTILDTVLLGLLSTEKAVGLYTAAVKLAKVSLPFVTSIGAILIPQISKQIAEEKFGEVQTLLNRSFHFIIFFSIPISLGLFLLAPEFIEVFSGQKFADAVVAMRLVAGLPILIGLGYFFAFQVLVPGGRYKEMFYSVLGGMASCLLLNFLLVPRLQENGTAIANICSELVVTLIYFYFIRKHFNYHYKWSYVIRSLVSSIFFWPLVMAVHQLGLDAISTLILSVAGCALSYFLLQYLVFKDQLAHSIARAAKLKKRDINELTDND